MISDPVISFAQRRFGRDEPAAPNSIPRGSVPDWVVRARTQVARATAGAPPNQQRDPAPTQDVRDGSAIIVLADEAPVVEGKLPAFQRQHAADGTTADNFAFYLPFHFFQETWGIYILASGIWSVARRLANPTEDSDANSLAYAYTLLVEHERLHFLAEYCSSRIEVVTAASSYEGYFANDEAARHEEALANAYSIRGLKKDAPWDVVKAAKAWMTTQPPGYCAFEEWLPPPRHVAGERLAASHMNWPNAALNFLDPSPRDSDYSCHPAEFLFRHIRKELVPVYLVLDTSLASLRFARPFPKELGMRVFVYSNDHKPPHIHIECPPGEMRTRYKWPDLVPLEGDEKLSSAEVKRLRQYVAVHGRKINERVASIPWQ